MLESNFPKNYVYQSTAGGSQFAVYFPKTPYTEMRLIGAEMLQDIEQHDRLVLHFKGKPSEKEISIISGDPVEFVILTNNVQHRWYGYVHSIEPIDDLDSNNTDILCVGASYLLKNTDQKIYTNVTADQVVSKIAKKHGMKATTQRHPRVRKSIVQAGQSDWQLLRRLANQTGFALRADGTNLVFVSKNKIFNTNKNSAPYFNYIDQETGGVAVKYNRSYGSILAFTPQISDENPELGARVDRVVTGYNRGTDKVIETTHQIKDFSTEDRGIVIPSEDFFDE